MRMYKFEMRTHRKAVILNVIHTLLVTLELYVPTKFEILIRKMVYVCKRLSAITKLFMVTKSA